MLLLLTILLVLVAAVTLLIGIFSDELTLIWISIASSFGAAVVLGVLSQMSRKRVRATPATEAPEAPAPAPAAAAEPTLATPLVERAEEERAEPEPTVAPAVGAAGEEEPVSADELPIAGYDDLRVSQILPKLDDLDLDELELVAIYEEENKNRTTVLNRIDELIDEREAEEAVPAPAPAAVVATGDEEPLPGYDDMTVREVLDRIDELDADDLDALAAYEEDHKDRTTLLNAIDARLDELEGGVAPAPAKKAPKKAAKRAPKKTTAKKATKTTKKAAAKKGAAKKAAAKKTTAKKAAGKKAAGKKATKRSAKKTAKKSTKKR